MAELHYRQCDPTTSPSKLPSGRGVQPLSLEQQAMQVVGHWVGLHSLCIHMEHFILKMLFSVVESKYIYCMVLA